MTKTITSKVVEAIVNAPKAKVNRRTMHVLDHSEILGLSKSEDSATRRLREKAQDYPGVAYELKDNRYLIDPQFVKWLKKNQ
jgi:hypothetical protein